MKSWNLIGWTIVLMFGAGLLWMLLLTGKIQFARFKSKRVSVAVGQIWYQDWQPFFITAVSSEGVSIQTRDPRIPRSQVNLMWVDTSEQWKERVAHRFIVLGRDGWNASPQSRPVMIV